MYLRLITFVAVCGALAFGGYEISVMRGRSTPAFTEVIAAAGGEPSHSSGSESAQDPQSYRISSLSVFSNVALHVKDNYVDPERIDPKSMLLAALREVERQVAEVLVEELGDGQVRIRVLDHEKLVRVDDVENLWEINLRLRDVFRFLERHLPPQKDIRLIEYAAVNGALSTLDPHSVLLKPEAFAEMKTSTKGEFGGLGIVISIRETKLTIVSPLEGTPAWRAGLKAGDAITRIGDVSTVSMPIEEAVRMLRGPEGSKVTIWIDRKGWNEARKFTITRERIKIESVESELLSDNVGYIKIKNFQQNTGKDLEDSLSKLTAESGGKLQGLVLDLRNNPGGLLEQAIRVSDKFLTSGDIVTTVGNGNKLREPKRARWAGTQSELPIAVLVNKGSASASEIVAGALKNLDRAVVIGERTFGKGSVQVLYDFADNSALKLTIAQYLTPGGISIQNEGVSPDIELNRAWLEEGSVRLFHHPQGHREQNLDKHLERASSALAAESAPAYSLTYLIDRNEQEPEALPEEARTFAEDYPMKLARELLVAVGSPSRNHMLGASAAFMRQHHASEDERISVKLKNLGVDWSAKPVMAANTDAIPKAEVTFEILEPHQRGVIPAGNEAKIRATIKNTGTAPFHRLRGLLQSENSVFRGREFLFGKIPPGKSRSWSITTRIPKDTASRSDILKLKLDTDEGPLSNEPQLVVTSKYIPHPQFAYSYAFDDSERGDGDGVLEVGEGAEFVIFVSNVGEGDADDVSLRLKSGAGEDLFLERGRVSLGKITAGSTSPGRLAFRVRKNNVSELQRLPVELSIYDAGTGEWLEDEIALPAEPNKTDKVIAKKGGALVRKDSLIYAAARDSDLLGILKKGTKVETLARLGDFVKAQLPGGAAGWLKVQDVQNTKQVPTELPQVAYHPRRRPPSIRIEGDVGGTVVQSKSFDLLGEVQARSLRDMYVVLNDRKIFFKTSAGAETGAETRDKLAMERGEGKSAENGGGETGEAGSKTGSPAGAQRTRTTGLAGRLAGEADAQLGHASPDDRAVLLPFKLSLDLKEGINKVLVVARLDERVVTYRSLYISRRSLPAVAEVANGDAVERKRASAQ